MGNLDKCVRYDMALCNDTDPTGSGTLHREGNVLDTRKGVLMSTRRRLVAPEGQKWVCVGWVNPLAPNDWLDDTDARYAAMTSGYGEEA